MLSRTTELIYADAGGGAGEQPCVLRSRSDPEFGSRPRSRNYSAARHFGARAPAAEPRSARARDLQVARSRLISVVKRAQPRARTDLRSIHR